MMTLIPAPYRWLALAALAVALFGAGWLKGAASVQSDWDDANAKQAKKTAETVVKQAEATVEVVTKYVDRVKVVREKGETITKEVSVYVPVDSCPLSGGFRLLHDAAATNTLPETARIPDAPPVGAQDLATTVSGNYLACHEIREQLISLQAWVSEQRRIGQEF